MTRAKSATRGSRWWPWLVGVWAAVLLVAAFGSAGASASSLKPSPVEPKSGGTVTYALPSLTTMNWYEPLRPAPFNTTYDAWAAAMMYKTLFTIAPNGKIDYSKSIASNISWNNAGDVYTVTMNPKWHWSDGSPVTSSDVLFTWQLIQAASSPSAPAPWPYAGGGSGGVPTDIKNVESLGTYKFQITTTVPMNQIWFEYNGLSQFTPLPKASWDKYPTDITQELAYVTAGGTQPSFFKVIDGPFSMTSAVPNQSWTFQANPHYDGHKPYLSKIVFAYQTSDASEVSSLQTGSLQIGYLPVANYSIQNQLTNYQLLKTYAFNFSRQFLNFANPTVGSLLKQLPVRQALKMGIDQTTMIKSIYQGLAVYGNGPIPKNPPTFLAPQLKSKQYYKFDPSAGQKLLEKNGWHLANGVMTNNQGQQLAFTVQYVSGNTATLQVVQLMQQDWAKEGIKVTLQPMPFSNMVGLHTLADAAKWEIQAGISWSYGGEYPSGEGQYETGQSYNFYAYSDAKMDQLIKATNSPHSSSAQAQQALDAYDVYATQQLPELWMPLQATLTEVAKNVHGVTTTFNPFTGALSPEYWWVG